MNTFTGMSAVQRLEEAQRQLRLVVDALALAGLRGESVEADCLKRTADDLVKRVREKVIREARRSGIIIDD